uniref:AlNc14C145G7378 protein n=1 Tax=Albugo laibachii Nc14 TaxID=890382 RepID=F0WLJ1_9STRA|nr:AlNc14C145G7378 [Albugo laibachii Nc14]|eukprot:CCA22154.1 AlNc14C145G7378 [Albugo laibachii Nc14]
MDSLMRERWGSGKDAVQAIKDVALSQRKYAVVPNKGGTYRLFQCDSASTGCEWYVRLARYRDKMGLRDWHVAGCKLEHQNSLGIAKPSRSQLVASSVIRGALSADPATSAKTLVAQLRHQSNISASQHVMYRTKDTRTTEMFSEDPTKIQLLPSLLSEFQRLNPSTLTDFQCDERGRFRRALVVLDPKWFSDGPGLFGVDAAHMKHRKYNGVQIVLVGRDGNLRNKIAAVALVPLEDNDNYTWFFGHIMRHGFSLESSPVFSDRNVGLVSAADNLKIFIMFCIRHIIETFFSSRPDMSVPVLLLLDDFSGHWTQPVRDYATATNDIMLKVPPGYTSVFQPADVCWMKPFKDQIHAQWIGFLREQIEEWRVGEPVKMKVPERENVADWIHTAWDHLSIETIRGGYPITHTAVGDENESAFFVVGELARLSLLDTTLGEIDSDIEFDK